MDLTKYQHEIDDIYNCGTEYIWFNTDRTGFYLDGPILIYYNKEYKFQAKYHDSNIDFKECFANSMMLRRVNYALLSEFERFLINSYLGKYNQEFKEEVKEEVVEITADSILETIKNNPNNYYMLKRDEEVIEWREPTIRYRWVLYNIFYVPSKNIFVSKRSNRFEYNYVIETEEKLLTSLNTRDNLVDYELISDSSVEEETIEWFNNKYSTGTDIPEDCINLNITYEQYKETIPAFIYFINKKIQIYSLDDIDIKKATRLLIRDKLDRQTIYNRIDVLNKENTDIKKLEILRNKALYKVEVV